MDARISPKISQLKISGHILCIYTKVVRGCKLKIGDTVLGTTVKKGFMSNNKC